MSKHDLSFVRALAEEYARKYNPNKVAPFPYENVLKAQKDLDVLFAALEDGVSGVTRYQVGKFDIFINANKSQVHQNFTLGHELGHYFLHQDILKKEDGIIDGEATQGDIAGALFRLDSASTEQVEREANNFAASLLMPADLITRGWRELKSVEGLARIFMVPVVAMSIRLSQLGLVE